MVNWTIRFNRRGTRHLIRDLIWKKFSLNWVEKLFFLCIEGFKADVTVLIIYNLSTLSDEIFWFLCCRLVFETFNKVYSKSILRIWMRALIRTRPTLIKINFLFIIGNKETSISVSPIAPAPVNIIYNYTFIRAYK